LNEELKIIISAEIAKFQQNVNKAKKSVKDFVKEGTKDFDALNEEFQKVGDVSKKTLAVMGGALAGAATALLALGESTKDYRQQQAMLKTAFETSGSSAETAKKTYNDLYRVLGDSGQATEAAQHLAQLTNEEKALNEWTTICQGVYATFGESLPIESLTEAVNHSAKLGEVQGSLADALEWSGVNMDEFNEQLFWCNSESEREKLIRDTLNGVYSEAATAYETNNAAILEQNEAQASLTDAMAALGEVTEPIMTMLTQLATEVLAELTPHIKEFAEKYGPSIKETLGKVGDAIGKVIGWIADNWELVSTLAIVIAGISAALAVFSTVMGIVNAVMMASPVTWIVLGIVAAIAALVAIIVLVIKHWDEIKAVTLKVWEAIKNAIKSAIDFIVNLFKTIIAWVKENWQGLLLLLVNPFAGAFKLLYDNCDKFRNFVDNFISKVKNAFINGFNAVKDGIVNILGKARDAVKKIIDKIKGFFKFEWSLPKIKVPKFSITPEGWEIGDLLKGIKPKLGITWHARGGVFDSPTVFGYGDTLHGIGENGAEAVVPLENNTEWLDKIATRLAAMLSGNNTPIILQVDGKTFAKTAVSSINTLTRQQGRLSLNLV
jgi:phage-related minor tail protein